MKSFFQLWGKNFKHFMVFVSYFVAMILAFILCFCMVGFVFEFLGTVCGIVVLILCTGGFLSGICALGEC